MWLWDIITFGPWRRKRAAKKKRWEEIRKESRDYMDTMFDKNRPRKTRSSRGGAIHQTTIVDNDPWPPSIFSDYHPDTRSDVDPLDHERHGVMGARSHHGFKTGGGFGGEENRTGGYMDDSPPHRSHNDHSSYDSGSGSSYDSGSSDSGSSSDGGGGGGD